VRVNSSKPRRSCLLVVPLLFLLSGCMSHKHVVGVGSTGMGTQSMRQYYLFFGLMPLNEVNVQRETGDLTGYEIYSQYGFWDIVLSPLLFFVTGTSRTVTVNW
jgi:hypothetical protein